MKRRAGLHRFELGTAAMCNGDRVLAALLSNTEFLLRCVERTAALLELGQGRRRFGKGMDGWQTHDKGARWRQGGGGGSSSSSSSKQQQQ